MKELTLCLMLGDMAYFHSKVFHEVWGDDWNDAPLQHNAGQPYVDEGDKCVSCYVTGPFEQPFYEMDKAVSQINNQRSPGIWLRYENRYESDNTLWGAAYPGMTTHEFVRWVEERGGSVYFREVDRNYFVR